MWSKKRKKIAKQYDWRWHQFLIYIREVGARHKNSQNKQAL